MYESWEFTVEKLIKRKNVVGIIHIPSMEAMPLVTIFCNELAKNIKFDSVALNLSPLLLVPHSPTQNCCCGFGCAGGAGATD